jgi:uncharacterized membrane protein (DUF441 family)
MSKLNLVRLVAWAIILFSTVNVLAGSGGYDRLHSDDIVIIILIIGTLTGLALHRRLKIKNARSAKIAQVLMYTCGIILIYFLLIVFPKNVN